MSDWVKFDNNQWIKQNPDGTVTVRRTENVRHSLEASAAMRREMKGHKILETEAKETGLRYVASLPPTVANEMYDKCGNDAEKQDMFLRDHPEHLGVHPREAALPKKRIHIFPRSMRPRAR